jgi:hypothetical protein
MRRNCRVAFVTVAAVLAVAGCGNREDTADPVQHRAVASSSPDAAKPSAIASVSATPSTSASARPTLRTATTSAPPSASRAVSGFPNPASTGIPAGTAFARTVSGDYTARSANERIDRWHITGNLYLAVAAVTITNSQVDGVVGNGQAGPASDQRFTITDSTVGPPTGCRSADSGIGESNYTATRVHVRGVSDGFGVTGYGTANPKRSDVLIQDSFVELCGVPSDHSDGIQAVYGGSGVTIAHNTINQLPCSKAARFPVSWRCTPDAAQTAPVFISDGSIAADVRDNLFIGGSSSIRINYAPGGRYSATGNAVVKDAWIFGPVDNEDGACDGGHLGPWTRSAAAGNRLVTVNADFQLTADVGPLLCGP